MNQPNVNLKTYDVTLSLLNNEVMLNWQRATISLLGHSILILAWATIYATHQDYHELLTAILVFGFLLCVLWLTAALSGNTYHEEWLTWLRHLEDKLFPSEPMEVWKKHYQLLDDKEIEIGHKKVTLSCLALGVKDYFQGLPILFMAIYLSLFVYIWWRCYFLIPIILTVLGLIVWFICIHKKRRK